MPSSNAIVNLHQKFHDKFKKLGGINPAYPIVIMSNTIFFILAFESAQLFIKLSNTRNIDLLKFASLDQGELIALALITMVALCTIGFVVNKFIPKDNKEELAKKDGEALLAINPIAWVPGLLNEVVVKCCSGKAASAAA